jgi:L-2-hydroxyglutarate oxidase LhgO
MNADCDVVVIGAGVIGLAIARQFALSGQSVMVLEKAERIGTETSSRNSEVIHAGIYYPTDSLKARLCTEGRKQLYAYCADHGVEAKRCGKLIVATSAEEEPKLQLIMSLAMSNGIEDLDWLSVSDVATLEPEVRCTKALFSPSTGIVDAAGFMLGLQGEAEGQGAVFAFNTRFEGAAKQDGLFVIKASDQSGDITELSCKILINCAGHGAHHVARKIQGYPPEACPPQYFAKGSYCSLQGKASFQHLIYPVPVAGALGIHATLDLAGAVRFGPDIQWINGLDYTMQEGLTEKFVSAVEPYWPDVRNRSLTPSYCGIRPKIHGPTGSFADFEIQNHVEHGLAGLINLFGIESPGLTASLAIAAHVENHLRSESKVGIN